MGLFILDERKRIPYSTQKYQANSLFLMAEHSDSLEVYTAVHTDQIFSAAIQ